MVVFGSMKNTNGAPMLAVLDLRPVEGNLLIEDMQKVVSAYVKTGKTAGFIKNSEECSWIKKEPLGSFVPRACNYVPVPFHLAAISVV